MKKFKPSGKGKFTRNDAGAVLATFSETVRLEGYISPVKPPDCYRYSTWNTVLLYFCACGEICLDHCKCWICRNPICKHCRVDNNIVMNPIFSCIACNQGLIPQLNSNYKDQEDMQASAPKKRKSKASEASKKLKVV